MIKLFTGTALVLTLAACGGDKADTAPISDSRSVTPDARTPSKVEPADVMRISEIDFASYSRDLAKGVKLDIGESMESATAKIEDYFSPKGGNIANYDKVGTQTETSFSTFDAQGGIVTLVERTNMRDDSVSAQRFYAIYQSGPDGRTLADYGLKVRCARGENTADWQTALCP